MNKLMNFAIGAIASAILGGPFFVDSSAVAAASQAPGTSRPAVRPGEGPPAVRELDQPKQVLRPAIGTKALASLVWTITETVAKYHDQPCPREQMIAAGMKALNLAAKTKRPDDLVSRASRLSNADQLADLLDSKSLQKKKCRPAQARVGKRISFCHALFDSGKSRHSTLGTTAKQEKNWRGGGAGAAPIVMCGYRDRVDVREGSIPQSNIDDLTRRRSQGRHESRRRHRIRR